MPLSESHKKNFEALCKAFLTEGAVLMECHLPTGELVAAICVTNRLASGAVEFVPFATMVQSSPFEMLNSPIMSDGSVYYAQGEAETKKDTTAELGNIVRELLTHVDQAGYWRQSRPGGASRRKVSISIPLELLRRLRAANVQPTAPAAEIVESTLKELENDEERGIWCCITGKRHEPDWASAQITNDGGVYYVDVCCKRCGVLGCIGTSKTLTDEINW